MKVKIIMMIITLVVMATLVAFSPVRPVTEVEAQNTNSSTTMKDDSKTNQNSNSKKDDDKTNRLKKAEKVELSSAKGSGMEDKNITGIRGKNSITNKSTRSITRGSGQRTCYIDLDNNTDYVIDVYVDGKYRGTMSEYDDSYTTAGSGTTVVYGKAEFDDGSYLYWGPRTYSCGSNSKDGYVNFIMNP